MGDGPHDNPRSLPVDVLVVGAGPTGLTLAAELLRFGASVRIIDAGTGRARESRALAIQPRTLEVLRPLGIADELVRRGNPAVRLRVTSRAATAEIRLFDIGLDDSPYPFLLFLSQAETEAVLGGHLADRGLQVERETVLEGLVPAEYAVTCTVRGPGGAAAPLSARYVVGCDGAHSTVRALAGIEFVGGRYPQPFLLADLAADGLEPGAVNAFLTGTGPVFFFPLAHPAPWRLIAMRSPEPARTSPASAPHVELPELQSIVDDATGGSVLLREPIWTTSFQLHHRHAGTYRRGHVFLAGDAAHVHSPAGAQGMNTGIQDAVNLGWKLGLVVRGAAPPGLLDSYDIERRPVGAFVLRFTDRAFTIVTAPGPLIRAARTHVAPRLLPVVLRPRLGRRLAFRTVSQLAVRYRASPLTEPGPMRMRARIGAGARPGDRLPDAPLRDGDHRTSLHERTSAPGYHLLLHGSVARWDHRVLADLRQRHGELLSVHHLTRAPAARAGLHDATGLAYRRLRARDGTSMVVRPDGHIGCREDDFDLAVGRRYLDRWLSGRCL